MLKPLYSFAGAGVIVGPTAEQLAAVPAEQRGQYILQERVDFRPVIDTPFGADEDRDPHHVHLAGRACAR